MKQKINLTKLSNKELKHTNGGIDLCICKCLDYPSGYTDFEYTSVFQGF